MFAVRPNYLLAAAALLCCLANVAHGQAAAPDPRDVLRRMIATYARVSSYQDSGVVRTLPGGPGLMAGSESHRLQDASFRDETLVSFKTFYARPGKFRFEWRDPSTHASRDAVIWSNGKRAYSWGPDESGITKGYVLNSGSELRWYVDEAERRSSGAAFFVPSLLMKDVSPFPFADMLSVMEGLTLLREERIDGELCHVIKGDISGVPWALWVGKESHLLRKTRTVYTTASFHETLEKKGRVKTSIAEEVHRDIKVNVRIPEAVFRYRPRLRADDIDLTR
jgi:outer membrane lipoprotein-sorting protein